MVDTLETPSLSLGTLRLANRLRLPHNGSLANSDPETSIQALLESSQAIGAQARQLKALVDEVYAMPGSQRRKLGDIANTAAGLVIELDLLAGICGFDLAGWVVDGFNQRSDDDRAGVRLFADVDGTYTIDAGASRGGAVTAAARVAGLPADGGGRGPRLPHAACAGDVPPPHPDTPVSCCADRPWVSVVRECCVVELLRRVPDMHAPSERAWSIVRAADELTRFIVHGMVSEVEP